jgi:glycosyltransferase involved in cell wall biosynthesis
MRNFRPHIVHSWNSMCSVYAAPLARLSGAKLVNGTIRAAQPELTWRDPDYFRAKLTAPLSNVVVANSAAGLRAYGVPAAKGVCIHNGFDQKRLASLSPPERIRAELSIETPQIVCAFSRWKDYDTFVRAAAKVLDDRNDVTFLAVGDGPNLAAVQGGIEPRHRARLKFAGRRADVESIVNIFSVGVLLSVLGEGLSNAIMEYMALGKPVIATDCEGNRELIEEGETGYLVPARDSGALANGIAKLLDSPVLAERLGENGRQRIRNAFSLESMTQSYHRLYRHILEDTT